METVVKYLIFFCLVFVPILLYLFAFLFGFLLLLMRRPHRAKIFFSYSHRDTALAERITQALAQYEFMLWIDFGIKIEPALLEGTLSQLVRQREIFMILSSENAVKSDWVQFEIQQSEGQMLSRHFLSRWRDIIVLTADQAGHELFEVLQKQVKDFEEISPTLLVNRGM